MNQKEGEPQSRVLKELLKYTVIDGKYKIGSLIEAGLFTQIFFAIDQNDGKFAVKAIDLAKVEATKDEKVIKMIDHEHVTMRVCQNPHLMKCIDVYLWQKEKIKLIVMEYCEFGSLNNLIYIRSRFTEHEAKIVLKQILHGLGDLNRHGLIHRDCKSDNVCFRGLEAVLCDFGCSKVFLDINEREKWRLSHRLKGTIAGTNHTKSPEMLNGDKYDFKTDIWGVGIIFYEMLTGVSPFYYSESIDYQELLSNIKRDIEQIYDPAFIKRRLEKEGIKRKKSQCIIPQRAESFLKEILVFDQAQRINWQKLIQHKYLHEKFTSVSGSKCMLPFKDCNWEEIQKQFAGETSEISPTMLQVINIKEVEPINSQQQRMRVNKIEGASYTNFKHCLRLNQEIYFYKREVQLLMRAKQELCTIQMNEKVKFGLALSRYCRKRLLKVRGNYEQKIKELKLDPSILSNYEINEYIKDLQEVIKGERDVLEGMDQREGILKSSLINAISFIKSSKTLNELMSNQLTMSRVIEIINDKYPAYWNRLSPQSQATIRTNCPQLFTLFSSSSYIIGRQYQVDEKEWMGMINARVPLPEWDTLSAISQYFKAKKHVPQ